MDHGEESPAPDAQSSAQGQPAGRGQGLEVTPHIAPRPSASPSRDELWLLPLLSILLSREQTQYKSTTNTSLRASSKIRNQFLCWFDCSASLAWSHSRAIELIAKYETCWRCSGCTQCPHSLQREWPRLCWRPRIRPWEWSLPFLFFIFFIFDLLKRLDFRPGALPRRTLQQCPLHSN